MTVTRPNPTGGVAKSAVTITLWNGVSRATGFVRVLAVGAALGTTFLGNTYQSSNLVSNLLFEVLAAGLLSAPLVPAFVALLDEHRQRDAEELAGNLLGLALVALGALVLVLVVAAPLVMRVLTAGVDAPGVRAQEVRVGTFFLWFFLPQVLLYCVGAVASALLNADRRFAAVAAAPVANNLVVTATMVAYAVLRHGAAPSLHLALSHRLVLAVGTTAGVLAMTGVPLIALWRRGMRLRLGLDRRDPALRTVARIGAWGGVLLAGTQILIAVTLVLANRVEGGVVAYQIAYTFYLLPFALVAHPIFTALYPRLSSNAAAAQWPAFAADVGAGVRQTALIVLPAAALLAALGRPALQVVRIGALDAAGADLVARALAAYAVGLGGYALFQLLARASTATGDARLPAVVGLGVTAGGAALMIGGSLAASGGNRVVALGLAHSVAMLLGAGVLLILLQRRIGVGMPVWRSIASSALMAGLTWATAAAVVHLVGDGGRERAVMSLVAGGAAGAVVAIVAAWALGVPEVRRLRVRSS